MGLTIACGGLTSGLDVSIFLTSDGVDMARKSSLDKMSLNPYEKNKTLLDDFMNRGGKVVACKLCSDLRNYTNSDLLDGINIHGASFVHDQVIEGAAIWNF